MLCSTRQSALRRPFQVAHSTVETRYGGLGALSIIETDSHSRFELDVAGFHADELSIDLEDGHLVVSGSHRETDGRETPIYSERQSLGFRRILRLDKKLDVATVRAELADGVLTLMVARKPDAERRHIEIRNSETVV
ncbi:MAG: HSP20 family small heat-shock protein [Fuerstiella sp.]|nr:HSP20 family small heat-shock protein [Fuerstiella sp.]